MTSTTSPPTHPYVVDRGRLASLADSGLLGDDVDPALDRWTRLASSLLNAPIALLSMVDRDRQYSKSHVGLGPDAARARETPLSHSFCQHVVARQEPLIVSDARLDPLVCDNPAIEDFGVIAYAGQPVTTSDGHTLGSFCVIDSKPRLWSAAELELLEDLAAGLMAEIELRAALRGSLALQGELARQARCDALTGLANRRQLSEDLARAVAGAGPQVLAIFDLDGFKRYNDAFGHPAGDALLIRVATKLAAVAAERGGVAYRLGGDEFCVLVDDEDAVVTAGHALREHGDGFSIGSSYGSVDLTHSGLGAEQAMLIADERLYARKRRRSDVARRQTQDVLMTVLREREPQLDEHVRGVAALAQAVATRLGLESDEVDEVTLTAQMHDIGKVAIPDSILDKPGPLTAEEWAIMRQHTVLGERILSAAPALQEVATVVRSTHERWDGGGYPDGLAGTEIPLGARIVLACDAYHAITSQRPYSPARSHGEALEGLAASAGTQLDPDVASVLIAVVADGHRGVGPPLARRSRGSC